MTSEAPSITHNNTMLTHYEVLRISPAAKYDEIKSAFHQLARKHHPDKQPQQKGDAAETDAAEEINNVAPQVSISSLSTSPFLPPPFPIIQTAWETLRDEAKRKKYDQELLQRQLTTKKSDNGAIVITRNDLQEAVDEETNEIFYLYDCRCGEQLEIDAFAGNDEIVVDCPGCCFVYRIQGVTKS